MACTRGVPLGRAAGGRGQRPPAPRRNTRDLLGLAGRFHGLNSPSDLSCSKFLEQSPSMAKAPGVGDRNDLRGVLRWKLRGSWPAETGPTRVARPHSAPRGRAATPLTPHQSIVTTFPGSQGNSAICRAWPVPAKRQHLQRFRGLSAPAHQLASEQESRHALRALPSTSVLVAQVAGNHAWP